MVLQYPPLLAGIGQLSLVVSTVLKGAIPISAQDKSASLGRSWKGTVTASVYGWILKCEIAARQSGTTRAREVLEFRIHCIRVRRMWSLKSP